MLKIRPMYEGFICLDCLHNGSIDPSTPSIRARICEETGYLK